jgi:hypothetical protein
MKALMSYHPDWLLIGVETVLDHRFSDRKSGKTIESEWLLAPVRCCALPTFNNEKAQPIMPLLSSHFQTQDVVLHAEPSDLQLKAFLRNSFFADVKPTPGEIDQYGVSD